MFEIVMVKYKKVSKCEKKMGYLEEKKYVVVRCY